jgi:class 3 adenylate cyclase
VIWASYQVVCESESVTADLSAPPSGTPTFLFADVEASTRLWAANSVAMSASLQVRDEVIGSAIRNTGVMSLLNRPGFDGGSAYWVPTPVGEACWAA